MNPWFGHAFPNVLVLDTPLPTGKVYANTQPYEKRGWSHMEILVARIVKGDQCLISLKRLGGVEKTLSEVRLKGKEGRGAPVNPAAMAEYLEDGTASGNFKFTNSGGVGIVGKIYGMAFATEMAAVTKLVLNHLNLGDSGMDTLAETIRAAHAGGGLTKLVGLHLDDNAIGDVGLAKLLAAFEVGACANLVELGLDDNALTHEGVHALVVALSRGALPSCERIFLNNNQISDAGMATLASALRAGALPSCEHIALGDNPGSGEGVDEDGDPNGTCPLVDEALASPERAAALALRQAE